MQTDTKASPLSLQCKARFGLKVFFFRSKEDKKDTAKRDTMALDDVLASVSSAFPLSSRVEPCEFQGI